MYAGEACLGDSDRRAIAQSIMAVFMFCLILSIVHCLFLRLSQEDNIVLSSNPIPATLSSDQKEPSARQAKLGR